MNFVAKKTVVGVMLKVLFWWGVGDCHARGAKDKIWGLSVLLSVPKPQRNNCRESRKAPKFDLTWEFYDLAEHWPYPLTDINECDGTIATELEVELRNK